MVFVVAEDAALRSRLTECLETILNKAQEPPKSKKVQHSNAKNAVLFEAISLIIHHDRLVIFTLMSVLLVIELQWRVLEKENREILINFQGNFNIASQDRRSEHQTTLKTPRTLSSD